MDLLQKLDTPFLFGEGECTVTQEDGLVRLSGRHFAYASLAAQAEKLFPGESNFNARFVLKQAPGSVPTTVSVYFKVILEYIGLEYTYYENGKSMPLNEKNWTEISCACSVPDDAAVKAVIPYFIQADKEHFADILIKEASLEVLPPLPAIKPEPKKDRIAIQKDIRVGVIRWDAYFESDPATPLSVSSQVARSLGPAQFHFMAPWFTEVTGKDTVRFHKATQEQFDEEARLAVAAGIDYFAYCWYRCNDPMSYARKQHLRSPYRDRLKMCAVVNVNALDEESVLDLAQAFTDDCYLRFDGRPVLYVYDAFRCKPEYLKKLCDAAKQAGIEVPLYTVAMASDANPYTFKTLCDHGFDAVSAYSCGTGTSGEAYTHYVDRIDDIEAKKHSFADVLDVIPLISCGRDQRPRIVHPTTWANSYGNNYVIPPTGEELFDHALRVLQSVKNEPEKNRPQAVTVYAWNEHDEGGWCCPTVAVDAKGEPIIDADGNNVMNATYLNALARAIREVKGREEK